MIELPSTIQTYFHEDRHTSKANQETNETLLYNLTILNNLGSLYVENLDIENRNAHSIIRQLRHQLRTVNCSGNRQHPRNWCG